MGKANLRRARTNSAGISTTLTSQAICAKHCGRCPSNPFTHGGLYCTSGKSVNPVTEHGCYCFECELFERCGGLGYFCKFGSADQMHQNPTLGMELSTKLNPIAAAPQQKTKLVHIEKTLVELEQASDSRDDPYHDRFIKSLIHQKEAEVTAMQQDKIAAKSSNKHKLVTIQYPDLARTITVPYGKSLLEISLAHNIPHTHICGGRAKCSTCRVLVLSGTGHLSRRNTAEELIAVRKQFPPRVRLACQTIPNGSVTIRQLIKDPQTIEEAVTEKQTNAKFFGVDTHVAVLFSDIRSFTTFSETNLTYDVVQILNDYFATITKPIDKYGGYVDKYMGDGIMAVFGMEQRAYPPEQAALEAGLEILDELKVFNEVLQKKYQHQFRIGIGIDAGEVVMAKIGFEQKAQFTAIGDVVNTSSRIESETKVHGIPMLVSHNIYKVVKNNFNWGKQLSAQLKGKLSVTTFYEPLVKKTISRR